MRRAMLRLMALVAFPITSLQAQTPAPAPVLDKPQPMTAAGIPLPLRVNEWLLSGADGCAYLSLTAPTAEHVNSAKKFTWRGACRFGLQDGPGISSSNEGNFYIVTRYRYGIALNGPGTSWSKFFGPWESSATESYSAPGRSESISFSDWPYHPDTLDSQGLPNNVSMFTFAKSGTLASSYLTNVEFCSDKSVDPKLLRTFPASEQGTVSSKCSGGGEKFRTVKYQPYEHRPDYSAFPDGSKIRYLETRNYLCATMADCRQAWSTAMAAEWPEIQRVKAELIAAQQAYIADLEARIASLDAAFAAKFKQFAAARRTPVKSKPRRKK